MAKSVIRLLVAALCAAAGVHAQPHVSPVSAVGFTSIELSAGYNAVSISLVNRSTFVGAVVAANGVNGSVVTVSGSALNVGALLNAPKEYYLEILQAPPAGSANVGARFELDVSATVASANGTLTLAASSPTNTVTPLPDLSGCSFVIREHVTLAQVFGGAGNMLLHGAASAGDADQVLFLDGASQTFVTYWLREASGGAVVEWRSLSGADTTDHSGLPILPGAGVFVYRQPSAGAVTLRHMGGVRMNAFRLALPSGISLVSRAAPVDQSPSSADMTTANGWKGEGGVGAADQIQFWNGSSFDTYWLRANASGVTQQWRSILPADTTDYTGTLLLHGDKAFIIRTQQPGSSREVDALD